MSRQPNGFGCVYKIDSRKRKNPYGARVTDGWEWDDKKGKVVQKFRYLGSFPTRKAALIALADYNKNPIKRGTADVLFSDVYEMWIDHKKPEGQALRAYRTAYKHSEPLHKMKIADVKADHLEKIMATVPVGVAGQKLLKTFWNQVFDYALGRDMIHKNYSKHVKTRDKGSTQSSRSAFTKEDIQILWDNVDKVEGVDAILIMIYTGMRPSEILGIHKDNVYLEERYMIGGIKTEAGRDRVIPIHKRVLPLVERRLQYTDWLITSPSGNKMSYHYFLNYFWKPIKEKLGFDYTPHECRHTGVSLMTMAGIDSRLIKKIVGHSTGDITDRYTHTYIESLVEAIDKIDI